MGKSAFVWLSLLLLSGSALGQQSPKSQAPVGSAGEAAAPIGARPGAGNVALGAVVANPGSFQMQPVTQKVDITDAMILHRLLEPLDRVLLTIPGLRAQAWMMIFVLSAPKRPAMSVAGLRPSHAIPL